MEYRQYNPTDHHLWWLTTRCVVLFVLLSFILANLVVLQHSGATLARGDNTRGGAIANNPNGEAVYLAPYPYALTKHRVRSLMIDVEYNKTRYFSTMRARMDTTITAPTGVTNSTPCLQPGANGAAIITPEEFVRSGNRFIVVAGDSIARETGYSLAHWAAGGLHHTAGCHHNSNLVRGVSRFSYEYYLNETTTEKCCHSDTPYVMNIWDPLLQDPVREVFWNKIHAVCSCNGIAWLGSGLHTMLRRNNGTGLSLRDRHRDVYSNIDMVARSANGWGTQIVWQGSGTIDAEIIGADPPRSNFDGFYPYVKVWHLVAYDKAVCHRMRNSGVPVSMLPVAVHQARYPGVRCDGLHYFSSFSDWHCNATTVVVDAYVQKSLNALLLGMGKDHETRTRIEERLFAP